MNSSPLKNVGSGFWILLFWVSAYVRLWRRNVCFREGICKCPVINHSVKGMSQGVLDYTRFIQGLYSAITRIPMNRVSWTVIRVLDAVQMFPVNHMVSFVTLFCLGLCLTGCFFCAIGSSLSWDPLLHP